ncbi:hypothetical protein CQW23_08687 [Capsicum baccatum]|uniref:Uncharacterized protein n=1 Tax=Capsicum baccatum TaxID=33114 RepID=A0A2G2X9Q6_CAPBA|nr:hypothetical protein CQW23_08687 [Capsicum baccatum]
MGVLIYESLRIEFVYREYVLWSSYSSLANHADQPRNSQLITKYLKIGLTVRPWEMRRDEHVTSEMAENAVKTLMASTDGDGMRKRAADLSNAIKKSVMDGGLNRAEKDFLISHIARRNQIYY